MNMDFPERFLDDKRENSIEDSYFLEQVNESVSFENGHYYIALPFRNKHVKLPNNASQGLQRLKGLKSKITKNPKFKDDYVAFMDNLFEKGKHNSYFVRLLRMVTSMMRYIPNSPIILI
jgi:hypothetical protein